jgi:hypothetical protein
MALQEALMVAYTLEVRAKANIILDLESPKKLNKQVKNGHRARMTLTRAYIIVKPKGSGVSHSKDGSR